MGTLVMIYKLFENKFSLVFALLVNNFCPAAGQSSNNGERVVFEIISPERVAARQTYIQQLLDEQASMRRCTVAMFVTAGLLTLAGGGLYIHHCVHQKSEEKVAQNFQNLQDLERAYVERKLARLEASRSVRGVVQQGFLNGCNFAIATVASAGLLGLWHSLSKISWSAVKQSIYPKTVDFFIEQESYVKAYFDALFYSLKELGQEQARITTPEQLETFVQWRGMLCAEVQTNVALIVRAVEDFSAFAAEIHQRLFAQDASFVDDTLMCKIAVMQQAVNRLSQAIERVANEVDVAVLERERMRIGMFFKQALFCVREAGNSLYALVDGL
jgi:hypothetical protein